MSDAAFKSAPFAGFTSEQLRESIGEKCAVIERMANELVRRQKVAAGDVSVMTPGERLRHVRKIDAELVPKGWDKVETFCPDSPPYSRTEG